MMILHGEQRLKIFRPLKPDVDYETVGKIINVADKGKGALVEIEWNTYEIENKKRVLGFS